MRTCFGEFNKTNEDLRTYISTNANNVQTYPLYSLFLFSSGIFLSFFWAQSSCFFSNCCCILFLLILILFSVAECILVTCLLRSTIYLPSARSEHAWVSERIDLSLRCKSIKEETLQLKKSKVDEIRSV